MACCGLSVVKEKIVRSQVRPQMKQTVEIPEESNWDDERAANMIHGGRQRVWV